MTTQLYTTSRLRVLRECIQKHFYQYVLNIRTPSTFAADFGTVGHAALEAYLRVWMDAVALDVLPMLTREQFDSDRLNAAIAVVEQSKFSAFDKAKLRACVIAYHLRWGSMDWTILAVEQEFRYELDDALIGGKLDALIRENETGKVYVLEHKFTASDATPGSSYWEKLALDSQVSIYIDGAAMLGHEISGCIYDVIKRPEHEQKLATPIDARKYTLGKGCKLCGGNLQGKQGTGASNATSDGKCAQCKGYGWRLDADGNPEAPHIYAHQRDTDETIEEFEDRVVGVIADRPDDFLIRNIVVRLDSELPRMREQLLQSIALERVTSATKLYVRNPDACARYGTMCHFFAACSGRASIDDETMYPRAERAHPELASAA